MNKLATRVHDSGNAEARARLGIPAKLGSCHTGSVGGYAIEGHVPAGAIHRLLKEKPQAIGLAVPGMPIGSPGMDEIRWIKPVRPGDRLRVRTTVLHARRSESKPDRGLLQIRQEVLNQHGDVVMRCRRAAMMRRRAS